MSKKKHNIESLRYIFNKASKEVNLWPEWMKHPRMRNYIFDNLRNNIISKIKDN